MSHPTKVDTLRQIEFFHDIADKHLEKLAAASEEVEYPARHAIFHEHEQAKNVYFVVSGSVSLAICDRKVGCRQITEAGPGELIGWSPLMGRPRLSDTATTLTPTKVVVFDGADLLKLCEANVELGYEFMRRTAQVLAERLSATRLQLFEATGMRLPQVAVDTD